MDLRPAQLVDATSEQLEPWQMPRCGR